MKTETLEILEHDLIKEIIKKKSFKRFENIDLKIEWVPVLIEREKETGKLCSITNCDARLIYENENEEE